ncbi:LLM class flavin-dependent oxidoreductase [Natrarchaeobaculum aegyptiacum]|uniref:Luciferase-like domain-containing protein n=1 Tax=Natrarchaeobaculum aegyptiacum TaxID=745377 RepID=A0A2Z2HV50_9EURY|nr:LLM class flavin-dependent oxidoreductase [Natrarchaeobaculum aegyptiacum]ARS91070.1 hypothetical protein B1756_15905 [Natrarchaeobaculum aegyptiacum]
MTITDTRTVDLGYSITSGRPADRTADQHVEDVLDTTRAATDAGFEYVQAGDHHVVGRGYLQNVPISARLSSVTDRVATLFLLPLYHPVHLAEQAGTIAAMTDEFDLWCALGYRDASFEAFGIPKAERVPRFEESLEIVRRLWDDDAVTYDGEFYQLEEVSVAPTASPRICIGGSAKPAVERAARLGDTWVATPSETEDDLRRKIEWYRNAGGDTVIARRDALVLENGEAAREQARALLESNYRGWPDDAEWPLVGDPESVAKDIETLTALGVDEIVVRPMDRRYATETVEGVAGARDSLD